MLPEPVTLVGVDLGQQQDYTALTVIERHYVPVGEPHDGTRWDQDQGRTVPEARQPVAVEYRCRHLERPPLGTPYTEVVERVIEVTRAVGGEPLLAVDQTGVGRPVTELLYRRLREAFITYSSQTRPQLLPVTSTGGDTVTRARDGYRVPKRDLVAAPLVLMQNGALKIAEALALRDVLVKELKAFRVKINISTAHDSYEAWREGDHDDLVLAVALACWAGERVRKLAYVSVPETILGRAPITP